MRPELARKPERCMIKENPAQNENQKRMAVVQILV